MGLKAHHRHLHKQACFGWEIKIVLPPSKLYVTLRGIRITINLTDPAWIVGLTRSVVPLKRQARLALGDENLAAT